MKFLSILILASALLPNLASAEGSWADKVTVGGDFRFRHEYYDQEQTDSANHRQRMRARLKLEGVVNDDTKVIMQLASGGNSATSTNETFDSGYTNKAIDIDMAYINWQARPSTTVLAGKVKNTLYTPAESEILWDADLTPEGITVNWACNCDNSRGYFVNLGNYWYEERDADGTTPPRSDTYQYSVQVGAALPLGENKLTAGLGYHAFSPIEGYTPTTAGGNTLNGAVYENGYEIAQLFVVYDAMAGGKNIQGYAEYVSNGGASDENQGYILGVNYGKAKEIGEWSLGYNYRVIEADAVLSAIDDGDFAKGETDNRGHRVQYKYQLAKAVLGSLAYTKSERAVSVGPKADYDLAQADLIFKF